MDLRVRYTKNVIRESFLELLKEKPLAKVSVKAICDRAEINRTTYYKYYDNPYDLLDQIENDLLDELQRCIDEDCADNLPDVFRTVMNHTKDNYDVYSILFSENGDQGFRDRIFKLCYEWNIENIRLLFPNLSKTKQDWLYYFLAEGCNGVLNRWVMGGMNETVEEIIEFTTGLIESVNRLLPDEL